MKSKFLLSLSVSFFSVIISNAQINPGKVFLGGGLSYANNKNTQSAQSPTYANYTYSYVNIQAGKFVKENTVVGIFGSYSYNKTSPVNSGYTRLMQFNTGVFYRRYKSLARDFYLFGEADISYAHSKNKQMFQPGGGPYDIMNGISDGGSFSLLPGISYNLFKKMQVELLMPNIFSVGYMHTITEYTYINPPSSSKDKGDVFSVNANLNANFLSNFAIGFKFFL